MKVGYGEKVVSEEELNDLIGDILQKIEGKNARMCASALCYCIATIGAATGMERHDIILAAMWSINESVSTLEEKLRNGRLYKKGKDDEET